MRDKELYIRDAFAGADPDHRLRVRGIDFELITMVKLQSRTCA
jgi:ATP-dependent phosphoenolpyruvate carboxykinase